MVSGYLILFSSNDKSFSWFNHFGKLFVDLFGSVLLEIDDVSYCYGMNVDRKMLEDIFSQLTGEGNTFKI